MNDALMISAPGQKFLRMNHSAAMAISGSTMPVPRIHVITGLPPMSGNNIMTPMPCICAQVLALAM